MFFHNRKLKELREDLDRVESRLKGMETEWADVYDKLSRMMGRIVKSRARMEELETERQAVIPVPPLTASDGGTHHGLLTDRQKAIQQQILRRRSGG